jgi:beta-glucosidase
LFFASEEDIEMHRETNANTTTVDQRAEDLLSQLTLKEKVALLSGRDAWHTVAIERLGIPSLAMTDGPHGVRANRTGEERVQGPATSFPTGVSMASSWDPELIEKVGVALAEETRALGCDILLGPCVNIVRTPLAGRNFESYSEDPYLAGRIGAAWVKGLQSRGVGASLKHYACNNQEIERFRGNSQVDERALREIYLPAFETTVKETQPWTLMCSYNRINGVYASEHHYLLTEILRDEWGFEGVVVSDWGANHTIVESVKGGLDIEMPGPAKYYGNLLVDAVRIWQIDEAVIDAAARRMLRMIVRSGKLDDPPMLPAGSVNTSEHQALARELAEDSITLLKNEGDVLPLDTARIKSIAVIGLNAAEARIGGGGSSYLEPPYRVSPLEGLRAKLGDAVQIGYEPGCDNFVEPPILKSEHLTPPGGEGHGLRAEFFSNTDFSGEAVAERVDAKLDFWHLPVPKSVSKDAFSVRWTGTFTAPDTGRHVFKLINAGICRLYLDGDPVLETTSDPQAPPEWMLGHATAYVELVEGRVYDIKVEYVKPGDVEHSALYLRFAYAPEPDERLERAVELAQQSDVAIVFAGMPQGFESEGGDRPYMHLPGPQDELIETVAQANPNTIVVLNCGSPVTMPWIDDVSAVVLAYYPGQEGGNAVANVLVGEANPSGKLSVTFPRRYEDNPTFINYPGAKEVRYGEGIFVGYRYYDAKDVEPLFPFGFGLSYTTFEYSDLQVPEAVKVGETVAVSVTVKNTGDHVGKEVIQLYVRDEESSLVRPPKELKGFVKVALQPGESKTVHFTLDQRAFSFYDPYQRQWVAEPGEFTILVGASSRDIRARQALNYG